MRSFLFFTVVHHLDVVSSTLLTDPVTARLSESLSSRLLEDLLNMNPSSGTTTRHKRRTMSSTFLTPRHTRTNIKKTLRLQFLHTTSRIGIMGVTTINDDISFLEMRNELLDEIIDGITGFDEKNDLARCLQLCNEFLDRMSSLDIRSYFIKEPTPKNGHSWFHGIVTEKEK